MQCGRHADGPTCFSRGGSHGCCDAWEREPDIDDDDWDPAGVPRIAPYVPEPPAVPRARSRGVDGWWTEPKRPPRPPAPPRQPAWTPPARDPFDGYFLQDDD